VRTGRLVFLVIILAVVIVGMPTFAALGSPPTARTAERPVTAWQLPTAGPTTSGRVGALSASGWIVSEPMPAGDTVMVGGNWGGDEAIEVEVRSQSGGVWSAWRDLHLDADDIPDPGTAEGDRIRHEISEPVWIGPSDWIQVRTDAATPPDLTLHTVEMSGPSGINYMSAQARGLGAWASPTSNVLPRSSWDPNDQCQRRGPPRYDDDVRFAVVHHTAGSNNYSQEEAAAHVLGVCLFHVNTRGFDDIAYNFVVDQYGRTYEGRSGGIREAVIGGHALGFNAGSTGIVYLGTYTTEQPPLAARNAMREVIAWKLDQHNVDPLGMTTEVAGANTGPYSAGDAVTLPTVMGHRDVRSTACPGDGGYAYLEGARLATDVAGTGGLKIYGGLPRSVDQPVIGARPVFDVTFSAETPWEMTITGPGDRIVRSASGQGRDVSLTWDMRDDAGAEVPPGTYTARMVAGSATPLVSTLTVRPSTKRVGSSSAAATSAALSAETFGEPRRAEQGWPQVSHVVIASAGSRGDALVAATLGASYRAPVLLTPADRLAPEVAEEIRRLGATTALLVGDASELSAQIEADLREQTTVASINRRGGETEYHTAGRVGWHLVERHSPREAVLVLAEGSERARLNAEAMAAAAFGAAHRFPVLFVQPDELTEPTAWVLEQRPWTRVNIVGGAGVVTDELRAAAKQAAGGAEIREIAGANAVSTAAQLATMITIHREATRQPDPNRRDTGDEIVLAAVTNPTDGIVAGAAAAERGAAFLLVASADLGSNPTVRAWIEDRAESTVHVTGAGSSTAVPSALLSGIDRIIRSAGAHLAPFEDWATGWSSRFSDTSSSVHRFAIERIAEEGITKGCNADGTLYCPQDSVSRGQMASFIASALGLEPVQGDHFSDVPADHVHAGRINAVAEAGIAGGYDDGTYRPGLSVTRGQMASFIASALGLEPVQGDRFSDVPADHVHAGRINAVAEAGIAGGYDDGTFRPNIPVTRAQMATFLSNALDNGL
jgi:putative cell wall-binding protein